MIQDGCLICLYDDIYLIYEGVIYTNFKAFRSDCEKFRTLMLIKFGVFIQKIAFRKYVDVSGEVGLAINLTFKIHFN